MGLGKIIFNNFVPKIIALVLAIATWFYVFDVINSDLYPQKKETAEDVFARYKFIAKEVPVKPVFFGKSPEGYSVVFDNVKIVPSYITVLAPETILADLDGLETDKIDLNEYTRSSQLRVGLDPGIRFLQIKDKFVDVFLPVTSVNNDIIKKKQIRSE